MRLPVPIIREGGVEIDRNAVAVRARLAGVGDGTAIVGAGDRIGGAFEVFGQRIDFRRDGAQAVYRRH